MASDDKKIYLGRRGTIHGPFSSAELEQLRLSGEIEKYTYQWDVDAKTWRNLEPPPPAPGAPAKAADSPAWSRFEAICHNFQDIVGGLLENVTDAGCDFVSPDPSDSPKLALKSSLVLNVIDPSQAKAMNVKASLSEITRKDGHWIYHLRWAHRPSF